MKRPLSLLSLPGDQHCPLCGAALWAPAAEVLGCRNCPRCGAALWFLSGTDGPVFFVRTPGQSRAGFLAALAGVTTEEMEATLKQVDSLDLVELVLEIEDGLRSGSG
jgi:hypothetical protein